ncbi:MAG: HEAT repeat domain-containing protein [Xenococcaceae cyanobacterium MO_188.B19]|nr:HEAT repeat domain-containing protein [Xenococcaceae cyanobacterium MO_188.B19]
MKHSSTLTTTLHEAYLAAQQQNWFQVECYLQQVCLSQELEIIDGEIAQQAFDLALEVLFEGDFPQKWAITKFFPTLGKQVILPLIAILEDETINPEVHWFVIKILGQFPESIVIITLANIIQTTKEADVRSIASQTLAHIGKPAIEVLINLLEEPKYRLFAVRALAHIRTIETISPLIEASQDPRPEIRAIAIEALGSFHSDPIPSILVSALQDTSSLVRKEAVTALGFRQDIATELNLIDHLQPLLYDINLNVCGQTAIALGKMQDRKSATALFEVLQSSHTPLDLKLIIVRALGWSEMELALDYLEQALHQSEQLICQEIITILGRILEPKLKTKATKILIDFAHFEPKKISEYQLKAVLATSLGELGQVIAQDILKELGQDPESKVRLHAIAALKKLSK